MRVVCPSGSERTTGPTITQTTSQRNNRRLAPRSSLRVASSAVCRAGPRITLSSGSVREYPPEPTSLPVKAEPSTSHASRSNREVATRLDAARRAGPTLLRVPRQTAGVDRCLASSGTRSPPTRCRGTTSAPEGSIGVPSRAEASEAARTEKPVSDTRRRCGAVPGPVRTHGLEVEHREQAVVLPARSGTSRSTTPQSLPRAGSTLRGLTVESSEVEPVCRLSRRDQIHRSIGKAARLLGTQSVRHPWMGKALRQLRRTLGSVAITWSKCSAIPVAAWPLPVPQSHATSRPGASRASCSNNAGG